MSTRSTPLELLEAGRERLVENGWAQGDFMDSEFHYCAVGALHGFRGFFNIDTQEFDYNSPRYSAALDEAVLFLDNAVKRNIDRTGEVLPGIERYNDMIAKSINDVLAVYDDAIVMAKEAERDGKKPERTKGIVW